MAAQPIELWHRLCRWRNCRPSRYAGVPHARKAPQILLSAAPWAARAFPAGRPEAKRARAGSSSMKPGRVISWTVGAMLALAAVRLVIGQAAIDAAFRDHLVRQARLELRLARLNAEAELAREHRDKLSRRMDRIEAQH